MSPGLSMAEPPARRTAAAAADLAGHSAVRYASPVDFDTTRALINKRLLLSGLQALASGRVQRPGRPTLAEAQQRADASDHGRVTGDDSALVDATCALSCAADRLAAPGH
jgi:hypothetical protein